VRCDLALGEFAHAHLHLTLFVVEFEIHFCAQTRVRSA
jgi:hypothetical protein